MFSATVSTGTSMKCWWTMLMPRAIASDGPVRLTSVPSSRIWPASGRASPYRMFMSVVLPAPFSPSRAWISPGRTSRSIESLATTPGYRFVMPRISSAGARTAWASDVIGASRCRARYRYAAGGSALRSTRPLGSPGQGAGTIGFGAGVLPQAGAGGQVTRVPAFIPALAVSMVAWMSAGSLDAAP